MPRPLCSSMASGSRAPFRRKSCVRFSTTPWQNKNRLFPPLPHIVFSSASHLCRRPNITCRSGLGMLTSARTWSRLVNRNLVRALFFVFLMSRAAAAPPQTDNWKEYVYADDGFAVSAPVQPKMNKGPVKSAAGEIELHYYG